MRFRSSGLDIDAFPDTTPVQVQINTVAPALSPEEVEREITFPIEQAISGLPGLEQLRSISKFGMSQVVVLFEDGTDIYFARQLIGERLATVELSQSIGRPKMGPVATGLGEVFHYIVTGQGTDATDLRTIHDWVIKPPMRTVRGTAEINSWGGYEKQYQIRIDPDRLIKHGLTFGEVVEAARRNNFNVGGGSIRQESGMLLVQGLGRATDIEQIRQIVITAEEGVPVRISDVAEVVIGHEIRRGAVTANGQGEVVLGLGFMLMGENSHAVTWAMKDKLKVDRGEPAHECPGQAGLRPHAIGRLCHRHGAKEPVRGRAASDRGAVRLFGQHAGGADRCRRDSDFDAVRLYGNVAVWHRRQPAQPRRDRFRNDRG